MCDTKDTLAAMRIEANLIGSDVLAANVQRVLMRYGGDLVLAVESGEVSKRYAVDVLGYEPIEDRRKKVGEISDAMRARLERLYGGYPPESMLSSCAGPRPDFDGILGAVKAPSTPCWAEVGVTHTGQKKFVATGGVSSVAQKFENTLRNNGPGFVWNM